MKIDPYATHLPTLERVVTADSHVVEFGCGIHSTPFLVSRAKSVMSIEQMNEEWIAKARAIIGENRKWNPILALGPWAFMNVILPTIVDVAFVDGIPSTRWACVCLMMRLRIPVIVAHDTEFRRPYGWNHIHESGYVVTTDKTHTPWTTTWTRI